MKRNSVLSSIALSVALSAFLTGCGSSGTTTDNTENPQQPQLSTTTIDGKAVDGYLQYATVCLDLNNDGYCQADEPSTQTDENGTFKLKFTQQTEKNPHFDTAMLLVYGGKDADTDEDFIGKLLAPKDGTQIVITPVTTLVAKQLQKELQTQNRLTKEEIKAKIKAAKQKVAQALDISEDAIDKDPVEEHQKGNDDLIKKSLQLQKAVEALLAAASDENNKNDRAEKIYEALADTLDDLSDQLKGVDALLDATLKKAQTQEQIKEKLGGETSLRIGEAAKKVAKTIGQSFEELDDDIKKEQDFLKKIAIITKEDLKKLKTAIKEGTEDQVADEISSKDEFFKPDFDWAAKFLEHDLEIIGEKATPELIEKLKTLFKNDKIGPKTLFEKRKLLKESTDEQLQAIYQKIERYHNQEEAKKAEHEAEVSGKILSLDLPMTLYTPEYNGYGQITFNQDNTLTFQKYKIQQDGTFAQESDQDSDKEFILKDGQWVQESSAEPFTINKDKSITLSNWKDRAFLLEGKAIAGTTLPIPQFKGLQVPMPEDAKQYFIKIEKFDDIYSINEAVQDHRQNPPVAITSFADFIKSHCGTNGWFIGHQEKGLAFAGTMDESGTYSCNPQAREGKLIQLYRDFNGEMHTQKIGGEWKIKEVDGIDILIAKPYDKELLDNDEGDIEYPIFALKDGILYRGNVEPKGTKRIIPAYNESALNAIVSKISSNWETLRNNFPINHNYDQE